MSATSTAVRPRSRTLEREITISFPEIDGPRSGPGRRGPTYVHSRRRYRHSARNAIVIAIFASVIGGVAIAMRPPAPDEHYVKARNLVAEYEFNRPDEIRDYNGTAYEQALAELVRVDARNTRDRAAAESLTVHIRQGRERLARHLQQENAAMAVAPAPAGASVDSGYVDRLRLTHGVASCDMNHGTPRP